MVDVQDILRSRNWLLSGLDERDAALLAPHLRRTDLPIHRQIETQDAPAPEVVFPENGLGSIIALDNRGRQIEVAVVGRDGVSGGMMVLGIRSATMRTIVQVPGHGYAIAAQAWNSAVEESDGLRDRVLRYQHTLMVQMAQTALSNGHSTVEERLARWLAMCHERILDDAILLTHEFLSMMLGVRRAGVTVALHALEGRRLIRATRRRIEILDLPGLIEAANGAYGVTEAEYGRMMGLPAPLSRATLG